MTALRELFAKFDVDFDSSKLVAGGAAVDGVFGSIKKLGSALAGGAVIGGILALTKHTIEAGDELQTAAERIGLSTQALQQWRYVADLADVSQEELSAGLRLLQKNIYEAATAGGESGKDFAKLGIHLKDSKGEMISLDGAIEEIADRFKEMQNPIEKTALAQKLFGRGGAALVPLLSKGREGVKELREEFEALGGGLNDETIAAANDADDAFKRLRFGLRSLISNATLPFIQAATWVATKLKEWVIYFQHITKGTAFVQAALLALGYVAGSVAFGVIVAFAPVILSILATAAAVTAAILIIDDLINLFKGGKSVIGEWIDNTYGVGTASQVVETIKGYWDNLSLAVGEAWDLFKGVLPTVHDIGDAFKALGDDIAFVVDQWRHLNEFADGVKLIAHDIKTALTGGNPETDNLDPHIRGGAAGIGSVQHRTDKQGNVITATGQPGEAPFSGDARGGFGFFRDFTRFSGEARGGLQTSAAPGTGGIQLPETRIAAAAPVQHIDNSKHAHVTVAGNTKPDAQLVSTVKSAVMAGLDARQRDVAASTGGT